MSRVSRSGAAARPSAAGAAARDGRARSAQPALPGPDGLPRCPWGVAPEDYRHYHDTEWGRPVHGDDPLFERLSLEAFQAGLSWLTVLRRRDALRRAFAGFHIPAVAAFTAADRQRLLADPALIRNRAKIDAVLANARVLADWEAGELERLVWSHAPEPTGRRPPRTLAEVPSATAESTALAAALKRRGLRFTGPTTVYALMQACGLVNDHLEGCHVRAR